MVPLEHALLTTVRWTIPLILVSPVLLTVPQPADPFRLVLVHLSAVVTFGIALAVRLAPLAQADWFLDQAWAPWIRTLAGSAALVALVTAAVALVTIASSAALRFAASLQFLQLLSTLDIAWAGAAIVVGCYLHWGKRAAWVGGIALGVFCVFSIVRYLDIVGFTEDNGWLVSGADLMQYVIPFDMAAAVVAVTILVVGARSSRPADQRTAQARPQS